MKKVFSALLILILLTTTAFAESDYTDVLNDTADVLYNIITEPTVGSVGGEWAIIGLARSGKEVPEQYFEDYYNRLVQYLQQNNGVLHERKYTEYSRVIIALTAIGENPKNVAGYDLTKYLCDYNATVRQGVNGAAWALIALDSGNYKTETTVREQYLNKLLNSQLPDGGWSLACREGDSADADITGMVLQALSGYRRDEKVAIAIEKGLKCLSQLQSENGGFENFGAYNSESCVQAIAALAMLGISVDDERFVKNGKTIIDSMLEFYDENNGFKHTSDGDINIMATEQALYALSIHKNLNDDFSMQLLKTYGIKQGTLKEIRKLAGEE